MACAEIRASSQQEDSYFLNDEETSEVFLTSAQAFANKAIPFSDISLTSCYAAMPCYQANSCDGTKRRCDLSFCIPAGHGHGHQRNIVQIMCMLKECLPLRLEIHVYGSSRCFRAYLGLISRTTLCLQH